MNLSDDSDIIDEAVQPDIHAIPIIAGFVRSVWKSKHTATLVIMNYIPVNKNKIQKGIENK